MRILENNEKLMVSGGNLTQDILNFFAQSNQIRKIPG